MAKARIGGKVTYLRKGQTYTRIQNGVTQTWNGTQWATATATQQTPNVAQQPDPNDVRKGAIMPSNGTPFATFQTMTDDEKADVINAALKSPVPFFLDDSPIQRFTYFTGMNNKPQVMDDDTLSKMSGQDLYRTVHNVYNKSTDVGLTANDIYMQIRDGDFTMFSDSGGSAHGNAIYFATSVGSSSDYYDSRSRDNIMMHAKILPTAKWIDESTLDSMCWNEINSGTKLGNALAKAGNSRLALYALAKGYDGYRDRYNDYNMIVNRGAIAMSTKTKKITSSSVRTW